MRKKSRKSKSPSGKSRQRDTQALSPSDLRWKLATATCLCVMIWMINAWWLSVDTRPPVWDMAMHQGHALNYLEILNDDPGGIVGSQPSGRYPPLVHWLIALLFLIFHPNPDIAPFVNLPATWIFLFSLYDIAERFFGSSAARWSCLLAAAIPYLVWMSRETILDYWLMAWVVAGLAVLLRSQGFRNRPASAGFGIIVALGLLTKWLYPLYITFPILFIAVRERIWRSKEQMRNAGISALCAIALSGFWYFPRLAVLVRNFLVNAQIGALEGEPEIFSFQSFIYYLRLLEGYQLFALLFAVFVLSWIAMWRKPRSWGFNFLASSIAIAWLLLTLIRTKDPRFSMPLLPLLAIPPAVWIASRHTTAMSRILKICLVILLGFQLFVTNVGVSWLPQEIVLMRGYQGSLRWDWNLYTQHYFHILGPPRAEDWKQEQILRAIDADAAATGRNRSLGFIPDLPYFNTANFHLYAALSAIPLRLSRLVLTDRGIYPLGNVDYVIATDGDQGMSWTTQTSERLTRIVSTADMFRLIGRWPLPDGGTASLYAVDHTSLGYQSNPGMLHRSEP